MNQTNPVVVLTEPRHCIYCNSRIGSGQQAEEVSNRSGRPSYKHPNPAAECNGGIGYAMPYAVPDGTVPPLSQLDQEEWD